MQAVAAAPESLLMLDTGAGEAPTEDGEGGAEASSMFLNIGLQNGVLLRTEVHHTALIGYPACSLRSTLLMPYLFYNTMVLANRSIQVLSKNVSI